MKERTLTAVLLGCILMPLAVMGKEARDMTGITITSPAFAHMAAIPARYTCDGRDINPPLRIDGVMQGAKSLALVLDDPDAPAGVWVHWVAWNIPPHTREIKENSLPAGAIQGLNSWKRNIYGGPCPPSGSHRYFFKIYALDTVFDLASSSDKATLERAMHGHIIARGELIGTYRKK